MDGTRLRLFALVEWFLAAACVAGVLAVAGVLSRDVARVRPVVPVIAGPAPSDIVPASLKPGAISVPIVVLPDGKQLQVGEAEAALDGLGPYAEDGTPEVEKDQDSNRVTRRYRYAGMDFVAVSSGGRIVAIYR